MERKNRLAIFEHVSHKDKSVKSSGSKIIKRARSPENTFEDNTPRDIKRRKQGVRAILEPLELLCSYNECDFVSTKYNEFLKHIDSHVANYITHESQDSNSFTCQWENCTYEGDTLENIQQHLNYHGYHTKLKNIGQNILQRNKLPDCQFGTVLEMPKLKSVYSCEWEDCTDTFLQYTTYVEHVRCHINVVPKKTSTNVDIQCKWYGCINKGYSTQYKLQDHAKTHTKEKEVACPTCGTMFASKTKFTDHRKRQLSEDLQGYQCSHCSKLFGSERLLKDHMRVHINHYKCHLCDMTCSKPSMLAKHIRYRHLPDRPFKCDICNHKTVTRADLVAHRHTHTNKNVIKCDKCNFRCRSKWGLKKHQHVKHDIPHDPKYVCHCCDKVFSRGALLTKHLIKIHDFHWPSGHSRFLYKQDAKTGLFHLQVVRYESLEVTQEMIQGNAAIQHAMTKNHKFVCKQSEDDPSSYYVVQVANDRELVSKDNSVEITVIKQAEQNNDGDMYRYEMHDPDNPGYETDDTDNLIICS